MKAIGRKTTGSVVETVKTVVYAILIALFVRTVAYEPFNIPSGSMVPTLLIGDYLFVSKVSYGYSGYSLGFGPKLFNGRIVIPGISRPPERGDVAVFKLPSDPSIAYIKRIVGLPGDRIQMRHGNLYINDQLVPRRPDPACRNSEAGDTPVALQQGYIESLPRGPGDAPIEHCIIKEGDSGMLDDTRVFDVPPGHYFGMGDNRDNSQDSRTLQVGYIPADNLVGKARFLFFSTALAADPNAHWWQIWKWPFETRYRRLFHGVH